MVQKRKCEDRGGVVHLTRGSVRDRVAALQNLETLLRSPRIGPKAIEHVLPQLQPCCDSIGDALDELLLEIAHRGTSPTITSRLSTFAWSNLKKLATVLDAVTGKNIGARSRLALEASVVEVGTNLRAVVALVDLLDAATCPNPVELSVNALVFQAIANLMPTHQTRVVFVCFQPTLARASIVTDPQFAMALIGVAVGMIADTGVPTIHVEIEVGANDETRIVLRQCQVNDHALQCAPPSIVDPTNIVTNAAAEAMNASLIQHRSDNSIVMVINSSRTEQIRSASGL